MDSAATMSGQVDAQWSRKVRAMATSQIRDLRDKAYAELAMPKASDEWKHILVACREEIDRRQHPQYG